MQGVTRETARFNAGREKWRKGQQAKRVCKKVGGMGKIDGVAGWQRKGRPGGVRAIESGAKEGGVIEVEAMEGRRRPGARGRVGSAVDAEGRRVSSTEGTRNARARRLPGGSRVVDGDERRVVRQLGRSSRRR